MKKVLSILSILLVMVTLSAATISSPAATVNLTKNKVITMDQLNKEVELYTKNGVSVQQIDVLNSLIDEILIEQGAARDGYSVTDSEVEVDPNHDTYEEVKTTLDRVFRWRVDILDFIRSELYEIGTVDEE